VLLLPLEVLSRWGKVLLEGLVRIDLQDVQFISPEASNSSLECETRTAQMISLEMKETLKNEF
jgi:hypothetical protein